MEGTGLSESDISSATKIVLYAPNNIDPLVKMVGVMTMVCASLGGPKCPSAEALWAAVLNITAHEMIYRNLMMADPTFALRYACFLNWRLQQYFVNCKQAKTPDDVDESPLSFDSMFQQIRDGDFNSSLVLASLQRQLCALRDKTHVSFEADSNSSDMAGGSNTSC